MKTNKKNVKVAKKIAEPLFTIELDPACDIDAFAEELVAAKFNSHMGLTYLQCWDFMSTILDEYNEYIQDTTADVIRQIEEKLKEEEEPWYKKLWHKVF